MNEPGTSSDDEPTAVYEIRLRGALPEALRRDFATAEVLTTRTETVLLRRVEGPGELDELVAQLLSLGLVLNEVHEVPLPSPATTGPAPATGTRAATPPDESRSG